ncbi:glycosyltransferase family 2 protein [Sulfuracidifex metallicus]|uniref:Glycosyltransferase n=1 Tax=Sulfuracidifex metallicus DSM 6482 = JCM 9184 TaxID=523847 RepID=A0A6A9QJQ1_SULME|nr:glycosyltransferase family A protein [Sulfuracidifex metallicus]MUN29507.1 glycosyltransferase [Sulfuracidifex metallicus DSM 6482 = JCM 9184]WOE49983.1 glycosyltransferase family A protein [Sulfuracidifex metallicus DSM 6482 = JCM 9184]
MQVTIGIPTYKNDGHTIGNLLEALTKQTYKDFKVKVIMKRGERRGDEKTLQILDSFRGDLDLNLVYQEEGLFEEALDLLFREKADLYVTTDDDATPSPTWVEDHVRIQEMEWVGCATGEIEGSKWVNYPNLIFDKFRDKVYMKPYSKDFQQYHGFLTKGGLSVDKNEPKPEGVFKTLAVAGVNMSVKGEVVKGYVPLTFTLRGTYNESLIALNGMRKGFHSINFQGAKVNHADRESLSRTKNKLVADYLALERFVLPYGVNYLGFHIDESLINQMINDINWDVAKEGLRIALRGIEEDVEPLRFRKMLMESRYYVALNEKKDISRGQEA